MKGAESGTKEVRHEGDDRGAAASKSAQDTNRLQGEKSKSMSSETDRPRAART